MSWAGCPREPRKHGQHLSECFCPVEAYLNWTRMALGARFFRGMTCRGSVRVLGLNRSLWPVCFLCGSCLGNRGRMGR